MPLLIVTGIPSSGKTSITKKLQLYFSNEKKNKKVLIVSESELMDQEKNSTYNDSRIEKVLRGNIKTTSTRLINNEDLVIIDGLNYIKGFRYELYCISKQHKTPHCIVQSLTPIDTAWIWNETRNETEKYSKEIYDSLIMRYESPDSRNRWDSPMFSIIPTEEMPFETIYETLYERKPPAPNQSTQLQPLSSNNFLHNLDKCTQDIVAAILAIQKTEAEGEIKIPNTKETIVLNKKLTLAELSRIRRQFITYTKTHPVSDMDKLRTLFVQYLNKTVNID